MWAEFNLSDHKLPKFCPINELPVSPRDSCLQGLAGS